MTNSDRPNRSVTISVDLAAVRHNLSCARAMAPSSKIIAVVKADAYGHGMDKVLPALSDADAFAVATVDEAMALRQAGELKPIMVLQGFRTALELESCASARLWPVLHTAHQLDLLEARSTLQLQCWVKFDTGMGRIGFGVGQVSMVHQRLHNCAVEVQGIMSHLACADVVDDISNDRQLRTFSAIDWPDKVSRSIANSAALLSRKEAQLDWVRPGVMLYGASPLAGKSAGELGLQPAMRVTAPVIAVRHIKRGQRIGYGGRYHCEHNMTVAVVGAGYGDGYPRAVPDNTSVMFGNSRCPIVGRISMDSMVVDVSELAVPPPIDYPVALWGHSQLRVDEIAERSNTIAYEMLCCIRGRRRWVDASAETNISQLDQS